MQHPRTLAEVQALIARHHKLRVIGTRHSFNAIADSAEALLMLDKFPTAMSIDEDRSTVTLAASVNYGELSQFLDSRGYALHNLASLPHISVAGAVNTATHGSGVHHRNLAAAVSALELVTANGEVKHLSREQDGDLFDGAVVSLGALGVITKLTLELLPTFAVTQSVYCNLPLTHLEPHFDAIMSSGYSVSLFTDWQHEAIDQVWLKRDVDDVGIATPPIDFFGAAPATTKMHPILGASAQNSTEQFGVPGPWHERLPHFRYDGTPSVGNELQTEYFVARADAVAALRAVTRLRHELAPYLYISEIRTIAADNLWLSPHYHRDSIGIHFTWKRDSIGVQALLPKIEAALAPFAPRPHWGKLFTLPPERVQAGYDRMAEFKQLCREYDPTGKFRNPFLDIALFG
ncbi:MAG: FAD-binding protein [Chloroflexota bacterium]